ncbi:PREDICTED: protein EMSY-like [Cyprinodon variegatus]|uniref:protein EMSY-like n=1 Tax=Cyprinodon variegatus TaxID=28743 RepID=UPI0007424D8B|nr:PREDICTED: protein EMSY-like [Cyprinodon variegatus]
MIQLEKPVLTGTMPVVWPTILDLGRDECKRILRKLELEAYAGVISALRAQGDLTKDKKDILGELTKILSISTERHRAEVRRAVNDERLTTIAYHMSGPNNSSEWSIEGRRLVPLMPRLVPQTAFTATANAVASATANQNASFLLPAETGNKEVVVCYSYTSTTSTATSATATSGPLGASVKSQRPASPSSNVVVLPSGSTVYVKSYMELLDNLCEYTASRVVLIPTLLVFVGAASAGMKVASARLPSPKTLVGSPTQILAQFPKQQSPKQLQQSSPLGASGITQSQANTTPPSGAKPTIQIKQESAMLAYLWWTADWTRPGPSGKTEQPNLTCDYAFPPLPFRASWEAWVLIKPKPVFQTAVVSEQTRQLVTETLQQVTRAAEVSQAQTSVHDSSGKEDTGSLGEAPSVSSDASQSSAQDPQPVVHMVSSREQDWTEQEVAMESFPAIINPEASGSDSQSATSTIKALLELQQTAAVKEKAESKAKQPTIDLSLMAVPIQPPQEKLGPESPKPSASEAEPTPDHVTAGKPSRAAAPSQEGEAVMSSTQPAGKPLKSNSQVPVVTKPVAPASVATPSNLLLVALMQYINTHVVFFCCWTSLPQQPIITQSATVTKITFGGSHHPTPVFSSGEAAAKMIPESSSGSSGDKQSVSDILKISMMEAEIDPSTEPMVVDSSSDCGPLGKTLDVQSVSGTLDSGQFISSSVAGVRHTKPQQFSCVQGLAAQSSKDDLEVIEVIPQFSILPDSSQSNVVVEPSGFLEITNYTSQQLEEDSPMEQEVDSSNDEAAAASPAGQP